MPIKPENKDMSTMDSTTIEKIIEIDNSKFRYIILPYLFRNQDSQIGLKIPKKATWEEWEEIRNYLDIVLEHVLPQGKGESEEDTEL